LLCFACLAAASLFFASCKQKPASSQSAQSRVKWEFRTAGSAVSHPAIGMDGTIYFGTNQGVEALSAEGKEIWKLPFAGAGPPVIADDGTLYFESMHGFVFGVSSAGALSWQPKLGLIGFTVPPALGPGTTLFYANSASDLYAFQPKESDRASWSLQTFREGLINDPNPLPGSAQVGHGSQRGAPVLTSDGTIILPRQNFLHAITPGGSRRWDLDLTSHDLGLAALGNDGTIYVSDNSSLFAVDPGGTLKWRFEAGTIHSPVVDKAGVIYIANATAVFAINPDGTVKWRYGHPLDPHYVTAPVLAEDGTVYVGAEFYLVALTSDGALKWNQRLYSPTSALTIAPDGTIYVACGYSWLCAVQGDGAGLMHSSWPKQFHDVANTSRLSLVND
jgi:outer membrane protein assembly factor BamB